jgi:hypothetical protein
MLAKPGRSSNPSVTIGITLSTSAATLSCSSKEPFYIIVTARVLTTPHPEKPITLATTFNCFSSLVHGSFNDFICTSNPEKVFKLSTSAHFAVNWCGEDLRGRLNSSKDGFVTIPPLNQGVYTVRHEVPRFRIEEAMLEKGDAFRLSLSRKCLGTFWWYYGSLDELEGVRLRRWRSLSAERRRLDAMAEDGFTPEQMERILSLPFDELALDEQHHHVFPEGPTCDGEVTNMLALVPEGDAEFEID